MLLTLIGEAAGTLTVNTNVGNVPPTPATTLVLVHVTTFVTLVQFQPAPLNVFSVYPEGSVSLTVVVPCVTPSAKGALFVTTKLHWPVVPCVKFPVCDLAIPSTDGMLIVKLRTKSTPAPGTLFASSEEPNGTRLLPKSVPQSIRR